MYILYNLLLINNIKSIKFKSFYLSLSIENRTLSITVCDAVEEVEERACLIK